MRKSNITGALVAIVSTLAAPSFAAINVNQINQQRLIDAGNRSGKLSNGETRQLKNQQRAIVREEAHMRARHGGHLTRRDERILHRQQHQAKHDIKALKHNGVRGKDHLPF